MTGHDHAARSSLNVPHVLFLPRAGTLSVSGINTSIRISINQEESL